MKHTALGLAALALLGALGLLLWWTLEGRAEATRALRADPPAEREAAEPSREQLARSAEERSSRANEAATPSQAPEPLRPHARAALEIETFLRATAEPLPNVVVVLRPVDGVDPLLEDRRATSDHSGRCRFEDLRPGPWTIALDRGDEREVSLAGGALQRERFELEHTGMLRGIVLDPQRRAVPNAAIWLGRARGRWDRNGKAEITTTSDAEGRFELRGLPHELHFVGASASPFAPSDLTRVETGATPAELTLTLAGRGAALRGQVVDELGAGIAGAKIWVGENFGWLSADGSSLDGPAPRRLASDAKGRFVLEELPPGPVRVLARKAGYAPAAEIAELSWDAPGELTLVLQPSGALRGCVRDEAGDAIAEAHIEIYGAARFEEWRLASSSTGEFACTDLSPGDVQVQISAAGFVDHREVLRAKPGAALRLDVHLRRALSISGRLLDDAGQALVGWGIATTSRAGRIIAAQTEQDGAFELSPLEPGAYELRCFGDLRRADFAFRELGRIAAGTRELELRLPQGAFSASLRGRLIDARGAALEGVWIWTQTDLWPSDPVRTDVDGRFEFRQLAAGNYSLQTHDARYPCLRRTDLELNAGADLDLGDIPMPQGGTLVLEAHLADDHEPQELFVVIRPREKPEQREQWPFEARRCKRYLEPGDYELTTYGDGMVSEKLRVTIAAGERRELTIEMRRGIERQLVFPDPAPAWWHEAPSFRAELSQRDGNLRITHEFEADDLWPFSWWPCLLPGTYDLRIESPGRPPLIGSFVLDSLRRTPQPIRIATRELR